jgi:hypothetical protein
MNHSGTCLFLQLLSTHHHPCRAKADAVEAEVSAARAELAALEAVADLDALEERYW